MPRQALRARRCLLLSLILIGIVAALSFVPQSARAADKVFRAGAYAANITPPLGTLIVGGWDPKPATNIHDQLHARCLVLDDGQSRLAFVVVDNVGVPREVCDAAKELIATEAKIPADHVLISATHTHSAGSLRGPTRLLPFEELNEYQLFVVRRIADGVRCAIHNLEPAQIAWGSAQEPGQVFNRRWHVLDEELARNPFGGIDKVRMNPPRGSTALVRPAGPVDPQVSFISLRTPQGRPIALMANYSLHYVGGVRSGDISADYFAMFAERMGELLGAQRDGPPFVGIMTNGTSGDVNNINFTAKSSERFEPYEKMRQVAWQVADRVQEAHGDLEWRDWVPLDGASAELELAVRQPTPEMLSYLQGIAAQPEDQQRFHTRELIYAERIAALADGPRELTIPIQALKIGELGITAIPFEVFTEIGLEIKEKSSFPATFTIELANGSYGYLPTPEQHELGGYETWLGTNIVELEASRKITSTALELLGGLRE